MHTTLKPKRLQEQPMLKISLLKRIRQTPKLDFQTPKMPLASSPLKRRQKMARPRPKSELQAFLLDLDEVLIPKTRKSLQVRSPNMPFNLHYMLREMKKVNNINNLLY